MLQFSHIESCKHFSKNVLPEVSILCSKAIDGKPTNFCLATLYLTNLQISLEKDIICFLL